MSLKLSLYWKKIVTTTKYSEKIFNWIKENFLCERFSLIERNNFFKLNTICLIQA